jgi:nitroreductase
MVIVKFLTSVSNNLNMKSKAFISVFFVLTLTTGILSGQTTGNSVTDVILSGYTARKFTTEPVSDSNIELILKCGVKAPSARNSQLWKFTVVKDNALIGEIIPNSTAGNILIIVSGQESVQQGMNVDFDCALATENMYIAAQSLGLGAHIYTGPVNNINSTRKQVLGIPDGYKVISLLRVGHIDNNIDAVSSASTRKKFEEVVNYK